jgi:hypothetical protein
MANSELRLFPSGTLGRINVMLSLCSISEARSEATKDVYVYYPVVVAPDFVTFDAKLDLLLEWKRSLSADMLNGTSDISSTEFDDLEAPGGGSALRMDNPGIGGADPPKPGRS